MNGEGDCVHIHEHSFLVPDVGYLKTSLRDGLLQLFLATVVHDLSINLHNLDLYLFLYTTWVGAFISLSRIWTQLSCTALKYWAAYNFRRIQNRIPEKWSDLWGISVDEIGTWLWRPHQLKIYVVMVIQAYSALCWLKQSTYSIYLYKSYPTSFWHCVLLLRIMTADA